MKVLLINFKDSGGGAAIAAMRLVQALNEAGVDAILAVPEKTCSSPYVMELPRKKRNFFSKAFRWLGNYIGKILLQIYLPIADRIHFHPFRFSTTNGIFHTTNFKSECDFDVNWINSSDFDVVNLHWINDVVSTKDIAKISKPIVWTMHDSWPCCGAEHHPNVMEDDTRWQVGYYRHNKPASTHGIDLCRKVWNQKKKYLSNKDITFTAPSIWEHDVLKSSALFKDRDCYLVPNIMDYSVFYPRDSKLVRLLFGIPSDRKVIGFGAAGDMDGPKAMKGSSLLFEALRRLENPEQYFLLVFGPVGSKFKSEISIPFFSSGYVANPQILACLYSACNVFVNPSIIENFSYTCLEAMSCAVPAVAFDGGGTGCLIDHKVTGYLAAPYNPVDIVYGIEYCISHSEELSENAFMKSREEYNREETVRKYVVVYEAALKKFQGGDHGGRHA
ncbi:MAG: glycosyltransferase [Treponema sp.]|nr:glycosyltransferase [Treponema sp.]